MRITGRVVGWSVAGFLLAVAACVGDAPASSVDGTDGAAADGTSGSDGGGGSNDGSTSTDGAADASTFDPAGLGTKLAFWYRGSSITTAVDASVPIWVDDSSYENAAASPNGACTIPPRLGTGPNTKQAVIFEPSPIGSVCLNIPTASQLEWGTGDFAVFAVARFKNKADGGAGTGAPIFTHNGGDAGIGLFGNVGVPGSQVGVASGLEGEIYPGGPIPLAMAGTFNDDGWRIYGFRRRGSTLELYAGTTHTPVKQGSSNANISKASGVMGAILGHGGSPGSWEFQGAIAEIIGIGDGTSVFSDAERDAVVDYLAESYGL